jgi:hypothetical protein
MTSFHSPAPSSAHTIAGLLPNTRPLPHVSSFVVDQLPQELENISSSQGAKQTAMQLALSSNVSSLIGKDLPALAALSEDDDKRLALLDLMMIYNGLTVVGCAVPQEVRDASAQLSSDLKEPAWLTYGLLIRANPFHDTRSFSGKESEEMFYRYHELIEKDMEPVITALRIIMKDFEDVAAGELTFAGQAGRLDAHFQRCTAGLRDVHKRLAWFANLNIADFNQFRRFFIEEDGKPGASGLFSGHMQAFSIALSGKRLGPAFGRVLGLLDYYPQVDMDMLKWALGAAQAGNSLADHLEQPGIEQQVIAQSLEIMKAQGNFLKIHRASIKRALPEGYAQNAPGTGGRPIKSFIDGTIQVYDDAVTKIQQRIE